MIQGSIVIYQGQRHRSLAIDGELLYLLPIAEGDRVAIWASAAECVIETTVEIHGRRVPIRVNADKVLRSPKISEMTGVGL